MTQTSTAFELILVDDASTDNSGNICDTLASKDSRIQVIHHKKTEVCLYRERMDFGLQKGNGSAL